MVWVNIDIPTKRCTIHSETCIHVQNRRETKYKSVNKLKRDGGLAFFCF